MIFLFKYYKYLVILCVCMKEATVLQLYMIDKMQLYNVFRNSTERLNII